MVLEYSTPSAVDLMVYCVLQFSTLTDSTRPDGTVPVLVSPWPSVTVYCAPANAASKVILITHPPLPEFSRASLALFSALFAVDRALLASVLTTSSSGPLTPGAFTFPYAICYTSPFSTQYCTAIAAEGICAERILILPARVSQVGQMPQDLAVWMEVGAM